MNRARVRTRKDDAKVRLPDEVDEAIMEIGGLAELSSNIPSANELESQLRMHQVLSDLTRLKILWSLSCCELCPCVLKEFLKISDSKLSYHLGVLEDAGLVASYPKKNWKVYSITVAGKKVLTCSNASIDRLEKEL
jgi:ArsR family transcriptional regulator